MYTNVYIYIYILCLFFVRLYIHHTIRMDISTNDAIWFAMIWKIGALNYAQMHISRPCGDRSGGSVEMAKWVLMTEWISQMEQQPNGYLKL